MRTLVVLLLLLLTGCATARGRAESVTFVLARHAEKAKDHPTDPSLTPRGTQRAQRLADGLRGERVVAIYASGLRRTQLTAAPLAHEKSIRVDIYDASTPADAHARMLLDRHATGTVVVVGHSNTIPALARALCRCEIAAIEDDQYGRRIRIEVFPDGRAVIDDRIEP